MTNEELNKYLAEKVMGWYLEHGVWKDDKNLSKYTGYNNIEWHPRYWKPTEDRNQMAMCEEKIPEERWKQYIGALDAVCNPDKLDSKLDILQAFGIITAFPRQRAEALYKAMEE
jgi:hypothetical protein